MGEPRDSAERPNTEPMRLSDPGRDAGHMVMAALADGIDPREIVVVCRSLERSGETFERALARVGVESTSARAIALGHTPLGRALLGLTRYALLPGSQRNVQDLIAYLRHPGVSEAPDAVDRFERAVRIQGGRVGMALRTAGPALRTAFAEIERLRLAPERLAVSNEVFVALLDEA